MKEPCDFLQPCSGTDAAQPGDLEDQQQRHFNSAGSTSSTANLWDLAGLNVNSALGSPSSAPTSLSFESFGQSPPNAAKSNPPSRSQQPFAQASRVILPPRSPKSKIGHERKRTKLSTESTPFDNVDYWIQFDNEEGAVREAGSPELSHQKAKETQQQPPQQSSQQQQYQHQQPKQR